MGKYFFQLDDYVISRILSLEDEQRGLRDEHKLQTVFYYFLSEIF